MPDIAVSARRIIYRAANLLFCRKRQFICLAVNVCFNLLLDFCFHLMSRTVDHFNPVVIEGIVACRDHDAAVKVFCPYDIGNTRRCSDMEKVCVCSGSCQTCRQRILKHITASSCIFSYYNSCLVILSEIPAQISSHFECMLHSQYDICFSAETICPKIFTHSNLPLDLP